MPQKLIYIASVSSWDEDRSVTATPRVTPAHVTFKLAPDANQSSDSLHLAGGKTNTTFLMTYLSNNQAVPYVFTETVEVELEGAKKGSFITHGRGTYDESKMEAVGTLDIIDGSGTQKLEGVSGKGTFGPVAPGSHDVKYELSLDGISL